MPSASAPVRFVAAATTAVALLAANMLVPAAAIAIEPPMIDPAALPPPMASRPRPRDETGQHLRGATDRGRAGRRAARAGQRDVGRSAGMEVLHRRWCQGGLDRHRGDAESAASGAFRGRRLRDGRREWRAVGLRFARHGRRVDYRRSAVGIPRPGLLRCLPVHRRRRRLRRLRLRRSPRLRRRQMRPRRVRATKGAIRRCPRRRRAVPTAWSASPRT